LNTVATKKLKENGSNENEIFHCSMFTKCVLLCICLTVDNLNLLFIDFSTFDTAVPESK